MFETCAQPFGPNPDCRRGLPNREMEHPQEEVDWAGPEDDPDDDTESYDDDVKTSETEIIHQPFLFDTDRLVRDVLLETGLEIKGFVRYEVGQ